VFRHAAVLLLLLSWPAIAEVHPDYTFSQWEKLQDDERTAYIAGLLDSLETMTATEPAQRTARHYTQCLMRSRLTAGQLADFLREYVRARPEMQGSSVQRAINDYLNALCGRPFDWMPSHSNRASPPIMLLGGGTWCEDAPIRPRRFGSFQSEPV